MEIGFSSFEKAQQQGCTVSLNWNYGRWLKPMEFVFAPEERDFYGYERPRRDLAPLEAKPGKRSDYDGWQKRLRSYRAAEERKNCRAINFSPRWGEAANNVPLHFQFEFAISY